MLQLLPERGSLDSDSLERLYAHPESRHLRVNFITSLDGGIEVDGRSGPLGGPPDRAAFMAMRAVADVVMVGARTARAEDYGPVRLGPDRVGRRAARGQGGDPPLAVVTAGADLDTGSRMFAGDGRLIVYTTATAVSRRPTLRRVADVVVCGDHIVDLHAVVADLRRRNLGRVLCEGGPSLTRGLFAADLVDELCLTLAPLLVGSAASSLSGAWPGTVPGRFELAGLVEGDGMLMARYRVVRPEGGG
jgi:riboflavin biosynthesis pyrimidine reductase